MKNLFISLIIIAILVGFGILQYKEKTTMNNKQDHQVNIEQTKQEAIDIAQQELIKHYPGGLRDGKKYELVKAIPFTDSPNWMIVYDIPDSLDMSVEIVVDPVNKKVVSYKDLWS